MLYEQARKCAACDNVMVALFTSYACDYCETKPNFADFHKGWVVWPVNGKAGSWRCVFAERDATEKWVRIGSATHQSRLVLSKSRFRWVRTEISAEEQRLLMEELGASYLGFEYAPELVEIFPDHRYKHGPNRAFLAPRDVQAAYEIG